MIFLPRSKQSVWEEASASLQVSLTRCCAGWIGEASRPFWANLPPLGLCPPFELSTKKLTLSEC